MPGSFQKFELDEIERTHVAAASPYSEFLRRRGVSLGMYTLSAGGQDAQRPHSADEVYIVLRGRATLRVADEDVAVRAGTVVSVDHGEEHRFVDIVEDLQLLVIFAPPDSPDE